MPGTGPAPRSGSAGDASVALALNITDGVTDSLPAGLPSPYRLLALSAAPANHGYLNKERHKTPGGEYVGGASCAETARPSRSCIA